MSTPTTEPRPAGHSPAGHTPSNTSNRGLSPSSPSRLQAVRIARSAGWLSITAGGLFLIAQSVMWTFDQRLNLETAQDPVFISAKIIYLGGFIVLMFALITAYRLEALRAGRLGTAAVSAAIVGTMLLAGDLWFESFAVPWLAGAPGGSGLTSPPSTLMGLGSITSYFLFAAGWTFFGIASLRARVFPIAVSIAVIIGGVAGFQALLAPYGLPLGVAVAALGVWIMVSGPGSMRRYVNGTS
jgi:hypothetical protein